jgi:hypothetical protein
VSVGVDELIIAQGRARKCPKECDACRRHSPIADSRAIYL